MTATVPPSQPAPWRQTYVMRVVRTAEGAWRTMLQDVRTDAHYGFGDLAEALAFVQVLCQEEKRT